MLTFLEALAKFQEDFASYCARNEVYQTYPFLQNILNDDEKNKLFDNLFGEILADARGKVISSDFLIDIGCTLERFTELFKRYLLSLKIFDNKFVDLAFILPQPGGAPGEISMLCAHFGARFNLKNIKFPIVFIPAVSEDVFFHRDGREMFNEMMLGKNSIFKEFMNYIAQSAEHEEKEVNRASGVLSNMNVSNVEVESNSFQPLPILVLGAFVAEAARVKKLEIDCNINRFFQLQLPANSGIRLNASP